MKKTNAANPDTQPSKTDDNKLEFQKYLEIEQKYRTYRDGIIKEIENAFNGELVMETEEFRKITNKFLEDSNIYHKKSIEVGGSLFKISTEGLCINTTKLSRKNSNTAMEEIAEHYETISEYIKKLTPENRNDTKANINLILKEHIEIIEESTENMFDHAYNICKSRGAYGKSRGLYQN